MINKTKQIDEAISSGIKFIQKSQQSDGGFESRTFPESSSINFTLQRTVFFPALISICLSDILKLDALKIQKKLYHFLLNNRSKNWTFNYWAKLQSKNQLSLPDDLDDTACTLSAIALTPHSISGKILALTIKNLISCEKNSGGPYFTWVSTERRAKTVDVVVNSNIAYFLSLYKTFPKNLHVYLEKNIIQNNFDSRYYAGELPVIYFLSRSYQGPFKSKIIENILNKIKQPTARLVQDNALMLNSLLSLGYKGEHADKLAIAIINMQNADGSWPSAPFGIEKIVNGTKHFSSSTEFTTAVCIQGLNAYAKYKNELPTLEESGFLNQVKESIAGTIKKQPEPMKSDLNYLFKSFGQNINEIILLPFWVKQIVNSPRPLENAKLKSFSESSCWGWMAYRIFDDLLDDQKNSSLLPAANWSMLESAKIYSTTGNSPEVTKLFFDTLQKVELANSWEQKYNQSPFVATSQTLKPSEKSFGAAIAALSVVLPKNQRNNSVTYRKIQNFFVNYLSARQLNDDAHDWEQDLDKGVLNETIKLLFKHANTPLSKHDLTMDKLRKVFWTKTLPMLADKIESYLNKATKDVNNFPKTFYTTRLFQLLSPLYLAVKTARTQQKQTIEFLKYYRSDAKIPRRDLVFRKSRSIRKDS